ncbi:MAG: hypothetical protein ACRDCE_17200 [Cetobacterium sp.]
MIEVIKDHGMIKSGEKYEVIEKEEGLVQISAGWFEKELFREIS